MTGNEPGSEQVSAPRAAWMDHAKRALTVVLVAAVVAAVLLFFWMSIRVFLVAFAGILLAIFLRALSNPVARVTGIPPALAVALVVVVMLGLSTLAIWQVAPPISEQVAELSERLPKAIQAIRDRLDDYGWTRPWRDGGNSGSEVIAATGQALSTAAGAFSITVQAIVSAVVVVFMGVYLAATPELYVSGLVKLFPIRARARARQILDRLTLTLRHWLVGQIISMAVVGVLIAIGLKLLGVPMALTLGFLAGVLDFIPIVGPLISAVPAVLLAFLISPLHALYVVLLYVFVNSVIESQLLVPIIQRMAVRLPPALTILALLLGGSLFGFLGLLLATPLAAAGIVLVRMVYMSDALGDKSGEFDS